MFKKTFFVLTAALLFSLTSCSFINSPDTSGSVTLNLSQSIARLAESDSENLYIDVSLKGDYEQTKTISAATEDTVTFDELKPESQVYLEAKAYIKDATSSETVLKYSGKSDTIKIKNGDNNVTLTLTRIYSVTFKTNDGTGTYEVQHIRSGEKASKPAKDPVRVSEDEDLSYTFAGWYTSEDEGKTLSENPFDFESTSIKQDLVLYAGWKEVPVVYVTVSFNSNGSGSMIESQRIPKGTFAKEPTTKPTRPNDETHKYIFDGWYISEDNGETFADKPFDFENTPITENITLFAKWTVKLYYYVVFNLNGAGGAISSQLVIECGYAERPSEPSRTGDETHTYVFDGWYESEGATTNISDTPFDFENTPITHTTYLVAKWSETKYYYVSFNTKGGNGSYTNQKVKEGETATEPGIGPTKTSDTDHVYTFAGWYTSEDGGITLSDKPFDFSTAIKSNITLYAGWTVKQYFTVTFDSNNGSSEIFDTKRVLEGNKVTAPTTNPTKTNTDGEEYSFVGWYTTEGAPYDFDTPISGDLTLIALYSTENFYKVTFDLNGGTGTISEQRIPEGGKATKPSKNPEKAETTEGVYTFDGWFTAEGTAYDFDTPITGNLTLFAHYAIKSYFTVTFKSNNGTDSIFATDKVLEGNKTSAPESSPEKAQTEDEIYTFDAWYTTEGTAYDFDTPISGDLTLIAHYAIKHIYTVTFDADTGATSAFATEKVIEGNKLSRPATNPTKTDTEDEKYTFDGWYTSKGLAFDFDTAISENITLIAHYAVTHIYSVTFNLNGGKGTIETQRVTEGEKASRPSTNPTRDSTDTAEYTFGGWYTSKDNGESLSDEPFDFDTPIDGNLTLYAFWNSTEKFTVSFNVNGGTGTFESQVITNGEKATEPSTVPTRESTESNAYTFTGWYTSSDEGKTLSEIPFDFAKTKITKNIVLYAGWKVKVSGGIEIDIPLDNIDTSINVIGPVYDDETGTYTFTADEGFDTYNWRFDGLEKDSSTGESFSTTNIFTTPNMKTGIKSAPGYYDVSLIATKVIDGVTHYYSFYTQIKHKLN